MCTPRGGCSGVIVAFGIDLRPAEAAREFVINQTALCVVIRTRAGRVGGIGRVGPRRRDPSVEESSPGRGCSGFSRSIIYVD